MLGDRIKETREKCGLSRAQLAAACGKTVPAFSAYERNSNTPGADTLAAICDALDVSADYLLGRTDAPRLMNYAGVDPDRIAAVAGLCDRVFDLASLDAAADYERDALPVYAEILDALRALVADTDTIYAQIRQQYPAFKACSMSDKERASLAAAVLSMDPAALERDAGGRAFDNKLQNRINAAGNTIFSLLAVSLYNVLRSKPGADVPQLRRVITTGAAPGSSNK